MKQAISLLDLEDKKRKNAYWFRFEPQTLTVRIQYPLSKTVEFQIPPYKVIRDNTLLSNRNTRMDPGYVLWVIAKMYKQIYEKYEHYGVWGHAMGDLYFEGMNINWDGRTDLYIGS